MKKMILMVILVFFVIGMIPIFGEENKSLTQNIGRPIAKKIMKIENKVNNNEGLERQSIRALLLTRIQEAKDLEACIKLVKEKFPETTGDKILQECKPYFFKDSLLNETKFAMLGKEKQEKIKELKQEQIEKIKALNQKEMEKVASLSIGTLNKLKDIKQAELKKIARVQNIQMLENWTRSDIKHLSELSRSDVKKFSIEMPKNLKEKVFAREKFIEQALAKRKIAKEKIKNAENNLTQASKNYDKAKENYKSANENLKEIKEKLKSCIGDECTKLEEQAIVQAKSYLLNVCDSVLETIEKTKARVSSNENIPDETEVKILAGLDEKAKIINDIKVQINSSKTKEELNSVSKTLKGEVQKSVLVLKRNLEMLQVKEVGEILARSALLEKKLEDALDKMDEKNISTEKIQPLLDNFSESISKAKENYNNAAALWTNKSFDVQKAHEYMKAAQNNLNSAHKTLKEILKSINDAGGSIDDEEKPDFTPGKDLGYFIWQEDETWHICVSGDGLKHLTNGTIKTDEGFCKIKPSYFELRTDKIKKSENKIEFATIVSTHQDCLAFTIPSQNVEFDLLLDGQETSLVYFGKAKEQKTSPFTLQGKESNCTSRQISSEKACTMEYAPMCGIDGATYGNSCGLDSADVELAYEGECQPISEEVEVSEEIATE